MFLWNFSENKQIYTCLESVDGLDGEYRISKANGKCLTWKCHNNYISLMEDTKCAIINLMLLKVEHAIIIIAPVVIIIKIIIAIVICIMH